MHTREGRRERISFLIYREHNEGLSAEVGYEHPIGRHAKGYGKIEREKEG